MTERPSCISPKNTHSENHYTVLLLFCEGKQMPGMSYKVHIRKSFRTLPSCGQEYAPTQGNSIHHSTLVCLNDSCEWFTVQQQSESHDVWPGSSDDRTHYINYMLHFALFNPRGSFPHTSLNNHPQLCFALKLYCDKYGVCQN